MHYQGPSLGGSPHPVFGETSPRKAPSDAKSAEEESEEQSVDDDQSPSVGAAPSAGPVQPEWTSPKGRSISAPMYSPYYPLLGAPLIPAYPYLGHPLMQPFSRQQSPQLRASKSSKKGDDRDEPVVDATNTNDEPKKSKEDEDKKAKDDDLTQAQERTAEKDLKDGKRPEKKIEENIVGVSRKTKVAEAKKKPELVQSIQLQPNYMAAVSPYC